MWFIDTTYANIIRVINMKQIYTALEINEREIRILIGEYFNTRFNIIKLETVAIDGVEDFKIVNHEKVKNAITKLVSEASSMLGATIERVILLIPSYNFKRYPLKVSVKTKNGIVSKNDVARAISKAMHTKVDNDVMIINAVCVKYTVNGISSRRLPEREASDELIVDIDLLCADKVLTFDYVSILEECGVEIMDICLDIYAIGKEAALFEQTLNQNIVLLRTDDNTTEMAILSKGKLINSDVVFKGLDSIIDEVYAKYHIPYQTIRRLVKYNTIYTDQCLDDAIYAWNDEQGNPQSMTERDLRDVVYKPLSEYVETLATSLQPILDSFTTSIVVVGEMASMEAFVKMLEERCKVAVKSYFPETIGVRDSSLTALYGSLFAYHDMANIKDVKNSSINLLEFENIVDHKVGDVEGESLTGKIKNLFEMNKREK